MQITLKDILTTYWAQTVLMIGSVSFLIKRALDLRMKKVETKHDLFQQNRSLAIMRFMEDYVSLQGTYRQLLARTFDSSKMGSPEYVKLVFEKYERLYSSFFYFRILLDPLEQARYADLVTEMRNICDAIDEFNKNYVPGEQDANFVELKNYVREKLKLNNGNLKMIGQIFRNNVSIHRPIKL